MNQTCDKLRALPPESQSCDTQVLSAGQKPSLQPRAPVVQRVDIGFGSIYPLHSSFQRSFEHLGPDVFLVYGRSEYLSWSPSCFPSSYHFPAETGLHSRLQRTKTPLPMKFLVPKETVLQSWSMGN